jgi:hypothetical protein
LKSGRRRVRLLGNRGGKLRARRGQLRQQREGPRVVVRVAVVVGHVDAEGLLLLFLRLRLLLLLLL